MNKKMLTVILVVSHILCVVFGYCLAMMHSPTKRINLEETTESVNTCLSETESDLPTEELIEQTETAKATEEATQAIVVETETEGKDASTQVTQPSVTPPSDTQPPTEDNSSGSWLPTPTNPPVTEPPATQPPATAPPATQPPNGDFDWGGGEV